MFQPTLLPSIFCVFIEEPMSCRAIVHGLNQNNLVPFNCLIVTNRFSRCFCYGITFHPIQAYMLSRALRAFQLWIFVDFSVYLGWPV